MTRYPILFGYREIVSGSGFIAGVEVSGRALLEEDEDGVCMYGVNPGGFCVSESSPSLATAKFRQEYRAILFDIAGSAEDFPTFSRMVDEFLEDVHPSLVEDWQKAVEAVREGSVELPGLPKRDSSSFQSRIRVLLLEASKAEPKDNRPDLLAELAA